MLIPIGDDNSQRRKVPLVTYSLIAVNILVFALFQQFGSNQNFTLSFAAVPQEIITGQDLQFSDNEGNYYGANPLPVYLTLLTSMFMHASLLHIAGNMLYLFIFGDNLEDKMGRLRFLVFYLVCGLAASLAHIFTTYLLGGNLAVPTLGASGAISGVLGGYLVLFPQNRVTVILLRFITKVPAALAIGFWFAFQIISSLLALGSGGGGVAYAAHIGGFLSGLVLAKLFANRPA